jgi:hypothetical protein
MTRKRESFWEENNTGTIFDGITEFFKNLFSFLRPLSIFEVLEDKKDKGFFN